MAIAHGDLSPSKTIRSAKHFFDSSEDEHSGKESPFKSGGRQLKPKTPRSARTQRNLKLDYATILPPPKDFTAPVTSNQPPPKSPMRESPRRQARARVDYSHMIAASDDSDADGIQSDDDWSAAELSLSENDEPHMRKKHGSPTKPNRSRHPLSALKMETKQLRTLEKAQGPRRPTLFDEDSDVENRSGFSTKLPPIKHANSSAGIDLTEQRKVVSEDGGSIPTTPTKCVPSRAQASPARTRLASPAKKPTVIPTPPSGRARPSLDGFWDQESVTQWTEQHSPRKQLKFSPKKSSSFLDRPLEVLDQNTTSLSAENPVRPSVSPKKAKARFDAEKHDMAQRFLTLLDQEVANGEVARLCQESGGVTLIWSKKLNSTAGRANWRREAIKCRDSTTAAIVTTGHRHVASIELAEKVIDTHERLYNVMAHEFCHLCNFIISRVVNNPHGKSFKEWASTTTARFQESHGVNVTTKHDYEISYRYIWICRGTDDADGCGTEYQRHSKSIDPTRHTCGKCRGRLVQIKPAPRSKTGKDAAAANDKGGTDYNRFVKEHFQEVKHDLPPGSPMKDIMSTIGTRYRALKHAKPTAAHESPDKLDIIRVDIEESLAIASEESDEPSEPASDDMSGIVKRLDFLNI